MSKTKLCRSCSTKYPLSSFYESQNRLKCKPCTLTWGRNHYKTHRDIITAQNLEYQKCHPWIRVLISVHVRVRHYNHASRNHFGLPCELTAQQVKKLWERDRASTMRHPTIDRINPHKGYLFKNCRFIESIQNVKNSAIHLKQCIPCRNRFRERWRATYGAGRVKAGIRRIENQLCLEKEG